MPNNPLANLWLFFNLRRYIRWISGKNANWITPTFNLFKHYQMQRNIPYLQVNSTTLKLDVYQPKTPQPHPTLIYFHSGGWVGGNKASELIQCIPYLKQGFAVVNVEYRLAKVALAPAAVQDCRCALRWVMRNAQHYNFDPDKIVVSGLSAGGHLALTTGMIPASPQLDSLCPGDEDLKVAAIINWYGITDVRDLLGGVNCREYARQWMGNQTHRFELADRVSPIHYVRPNLPPILTIHGDQDSVVPYDHAVQLHQALDQVSVPNQLLTIPGGGHGKFHREAEEQIYATIRSFLSQHQLEIPHH